MENRKIVLNFKVGPANHEIDVRLTVSELDHRLFHLLIGISGW